MGAETKFAIHLSFCFAEPDARGLPRVVKKSAYAAWVGGEFVEVGLIEIEREGKEAEQVSCELEDF